MIIIHDKELRCLCLVSTHPELIASERLHMGLPSVRLSWSWAPLANEQEETKPRVYGIGNLAMSLAPFAGRLRCQGGSAPVRSLLTSPALLLWGAAPGVDLSAACAKAAGCVTPLTGGSKYPSPQTCTYAHTPHSSQGKTKQMK